jgi:hypothetical protein
MFLPGEFIFQAMNIRLQRDWLQKRAKAVKREILYHAVM